MGGEKESKRLRWRGGGLLCAMHLRSLFEITGNNKCVFKYGVNAMLNKWTLTQTFSAEHLPWPHFLQHSNFAATKKPTLILFTHTDSTARLSVLCDVAVGMSRRNRSPCQNRSPRGTVCFHLFPIGLWENGVNSVQSLNSGHRVEETWRNNTVASQWLVRINWLGGRPFAQMAHNSVHLLNNGTLHDSYKTIFIITK